MVITRPCDFGLRRIFGFYHALACRQPATFLPLFSAASLTLRLPPPFHILSHLSNMLPRNLRSHNARIHTLGSPPPTLPCPHCPRHFHSKTGRTRHIQAHHNNSDVDGHEPQDRNASPPSSPSVDDPGSQYSHRSQDDEQPPAPSDRMSSPAPSFNHNLDMDVDPPHADWDCTPPGSDIDPEAEPNRNSSPLGDGSQRAPDPPRIKRTYHPTINGA